MEVMKQLTKITIAWELFESSTPKVHIAKQLEVNRETVHIWIKSIQEMGLMQFLESYIAAKKGERAKRKKER